MPGPSCKVSKGDIRRHLLVALCVSGVLITIGTLVLAGWSFDIALLKSVLPGLAPVKPNTAICFILSGVALWQAARPENLDAKRQRLSQACALVSTLIGAVTLSEYLWSLNIGIDGLLFGKALIATNRSFPGRMAHVTALEFAIFGIALLLLNSNSRRGKWFSQSLALLGTAISLIVLVGYAYGAEAPYQVSAFSSVALHTALLFTLLGFAILCARPDQGIMRTLTSTNLGGLMARKILPLALTLPFLLGWIRLQGQYGGLYGTEFGLSIFTISNVLIFATLIWIGSSSLNKVDAERQRTTEAIQESEERFSTMANSVPQLVWIAKADGFIYWYNQRWYEYTGTTREQMEGWGWQSVHDPLVLPTVLKQWGASIATGKPFEMEFPLRRADGVYRSFLTGCVPLKNAEGQVVQWFGTNTDVTKLKGAEDEIRQLNADLERRVIERTVQFQSANLELSAEIAERKRGEEEIRKLNTTLERRVIEITTTLAELATSEQESRKNRDFLESIIENIPNMVFLKEARELRFFRMNKAGQRLLGYSPKDLLGKNDYDFFPKEEADFFTNADRKTLQGNKVLLIEEESIRTKEGENKFLRTRKIPLFGLDGTPQYLLGISEDITEHKLAVEALRLSEERFRLLVDGVQDYAIVMLSPRGHVVSWNEGAERIKGYKADEIIGKHFSCFYPPEAVAEGKPERVLQTALEQGRVADEGWRLRKDGQLFWANFVITAVFDKAGRLQGFAKITRDVTEAKRIEQILNDKNLKLEENARELARSNSDLEAFSYSVSHDLRAPLRHVVGFVQLLQREAGASLSVKSLGHMKIISQSAKRMGDLIDDLLAFSRIGQSEMLKNGGRSRRVGPGDIERFSDGDNRTEYRVDNLPAAGGTG